eukprot:gnl/MRDRNA2_/MRDRNA2_426388_c0_seq1.p1 gnl/MRDRNA2_/MRDRNA2_426388_c0~~gnl/MRDRNA2_/MRDRNA2_426388_c0_seq1.p1  ORF type:complete len:194 (-),score=29.69 gnl/MRDRNA2_/MRDRNA2_426388_c0_seq1:223-762(-)
MSGASPWLQMRNGKWIINHLGEADPDGRRYANYGSDAADPLFYFGEGLSYTTFKISDLSVQAPGSDGNPATARVLVTNIGRVSGTEVVQVYVVDPVMAFVRPWKRLVAFQRVSLQPGEARHIEIGVTANNLAFYDDELRLRVVPGTYLVSAGSSSYNAAYLEVSAVLGGMSVSPAAVFV